MASSKKLFSMTSERMKARAHGHWRDRHILVLKTLSFKERDRVRMGLPAAEAGVFPIAGLILFLFIVFFLPSFPYR